MARNRKVYLIDSENVGLLWLARIPKLKDDDRVVIFCSDKTPVLDEKHLNEYENLRGKVSVIHGVNGTPNAMDFCIVFWLGYHAKTEPWSEFVIVSNDRGFDAIQNLNLVKKLRISRLDIASNISKKELLEKYRMEIFALTMANQIPKEALSVLEWIMLPKYYKIDRNKVLAYNALAAGDQCAIDEAIRRMTLDACSPRDADDMKHIWIQYIPCIQRIYKENNGA